MTEPAHRVLIGDCRESMRSLPAGSVHCCVTSPPYWALRDYGVNGQLGLEETPDEYIAAMVDVFREVKRVLRDDGCLWVNIGDSYAGGASGSNPSPSSALGSGPEGASKHRDLVRFAKREKVQELKPKDLVGIPWRLAFALQSDGWYLRQDIIWSKPAPMPESVRDRCTKSHEYVFLLTKRPRYFYDAEAVKENQTGTLHGCKTTLAKKMIGVDPSIGGAAHEQRMKKHVSHIEIPGGRNRRSVWTINTEPFRGQHFAVFPTRLVEPCILAGTSAAGCCGECGKPWERVVEKTAEIDTSGKGSRFDAGKTGTNGCGRVQSGERYKSVSAGWRPTCPCGVPAVPCTVLDPFGGSGTTAGVALYHRRNAILCELNPEYAAMVPGRIDDVIRRMRKREAKRAAKKQAKPLANQKTLWSDE